MLLKHGHVSTARAPLVVDEACALNLHVAPVGPKPYPCRAPLPRPHSLVHTDQHHPRPYTARLVRCAAQKTKGPTTRFVCSGCGSWSPRWFGKCPTCSEYGTLEEETIFSASAPQGGGAGINSATKAAAAARDILTRNKIANEREGGYPGEEGLFGDADTAGRSSSAFGGRSNGWVSATEGGPISLKNMSLGGRTLGGAGVVRMVLTGRTGHEVNRVLGGGVVRGSLVLVGGEPGVGKSTLSLQIAAMIAQPDLDFDRLAEDNRDTGSLPLPPLDLAPPATVPAQGETNSVHAAAASTADAPPPVRARRGRKSATAPEPSPSPEPVQGTLPSTSSKGAASASSASPPAVSRSPELIAPRHVLYVSGEETPEQVFDRAERMGLSECATLHIMGECRLEEILKQALIMRPAALVVDSLQTMYLSELNNVVGAVVQLKECCNGLLRLAKDHGITVIAIGHVTKSREIAGPKVIEFMVDAVLKVEGDPSQGYRMLRAGKNRFGTTDEVGVFSMDVGGLHAVADPSAMFLANRSAGSSAVAVVLDGTRVLVLEVQALVTTSYPGSNAPPVRQTTGALKDRVFTVIVNVMHKFVAKMSNQNIVVSVTGGIQMREPAADLAIAVAIASSYYNLPVPKDIAAIGEVDLGGGLRPVKCIDMRILELAKLGLQRVVIPKSSNATKMQRDPRLANLELIPCSTLLEALQVVLGPQVGISRGKKKTSKRKGPATRSSDDDAGMDDDDMMDGDDGDEW